jgi:hypothetical protein
MGCDFLRELRVLSEQRERAREKAVVSRGAAKNAKESSNKQLRGYPKKVSCL